MATPPNSNTDQPAASTPEKDGPQGMSSSDFPDDTGSELERDLDELKTDHDGVTSGAPDNDVGGGGRPSGTPGPGPAGTPGKEPSKNPGLPET